jgi:hypothetical protein
MDFYQNLIGARLDSHRSKLTIVAAWLHDNGVRIGVRVMGVGKDGENFLVDLPDTGWRLTLKE